MLNRRTLLVAASSPAILSARTAASAASADASLPPPVRNEWRDAARNRTVPVLLRLPSRPDPAPVVVLSHGLGGSRNGLAFLGTALAAAGYAAVHLQHHGSDDALWDGAADPRASMVAALTDVNAALARLGDVSFALDQVAAGREPALRGRTNADRMAAAGHSYGAWTVAHMLGERLPLGGWGLNLPDKRLRAGIELSPIPPIGVAPDAAFAAISAPILYVTGTEDHGWGAADWQARTVGYRTATSPAVLAVLDGARHASFAGEPGAGPYWNDPRFQDRTARLSVLFLDAVLRQDSASRRTLLAGRFLQPGDTVQNKNMG